MTRISHPASSMPLSVSLLAVPETSAAVLHGLHEVFGSVGTAWEHLTGEPSNSRRLTPRIVAERPGTFRSIAGPPIEADGTFEMAERSDIVVVPDLALTLESDPHGNWPTATAWLRDQYAKGAIVASVCTGSLLLAEARLLDGLPATTHWAARRTFSAYYPEVRLHPDRILVPAGPEHRLITSGGSGAWADLAVYLIARFCGRDEAIRITKIFLIGDRSDGQLPFSAMARPRQHEDAAVARCQTWIASSYATPNPVRKMCDVSRLPTRTFKRRFRQATGYTPIEYVQTLRMEEAKQLLETTDADTDTVAAEVGYEDPASFRRVFKRHTGVTPARYRRRFRGLADYAVSRGMAF